MRTESVLLTVLKYMSFERFLNWKALEEREKLDRLFSAFFLLLLHRCVSSLSPFIFLSPLISFFTFPSSLFPVVSPSLSYLSPTISFSPFPRFLFVRSILLLASFRSCPSYCLNFSSDFLLLSFPSTPPF